MKPTLTKQEQQLKNKRSNRIKKGKRKASLSLDNMIERAVGKDND
tara:strand:- start:90 stop:224 length:135 start_codon:yes stop_codon:yes gene_type:complete